MQNDFRETIANKLYHALINRRAIQPLKASFQEMTIEDAYAIQQRLTNLKVSHGERVVGKKIGVTSTVVMDLLGVYQPDFGVLTDAMQYSQGDPVPAASLIQPKAEGEIAFLLSHDLSGPGVTADDVLAATTGVMACFEIVDSRIQDWNIQIEDTVADNASAGVFVLGIDVVNPKTVDLIGCLMRLEKNGEVVTSGSGAAALGNPLEAVAWLANTLGAFGESLRAGEVILSGSLGSMVPVSAGDSLKVTIDGIGSCSTSFY